MKETIRVKVTVGEEVYEVDSCWSQETEEFCEKVAREVKEFIDEMTCQDDKKV